MANGAEAPPWESSLHNYRALLPTHSKAMLLLSSVANPARPLVHDLHAAAAARLCRPGLEIRFVNPVVRYGIFARLPIPAGEFIGFYTGTVVPDRRELSKARREYAVDLNLNGTPSVVVPTLTSTGPIPDEAPMAFSNEPRANTRANMDMIRYPIALDRFEGRVVPDRVPVMGFLACRDIKQGEELTWVYGNGYERDYVPGTGCFDALANNHWDTDDHLLSMYAHVFGPTTKLPAAAALDARQIPPRPNGSRTSSRFNS